MECVIGIKFNDFVLLAADGNAGRSIIHMKRNAKKIYQLSDKLALAISGEAGDPVNFAEFILQNVQLYRIMNGYDMTPHEAAHFTRYQLASRLRTRGAHMVNLLMAGIETGAGEAEGAVQTQTKLFFMDYLGSLVTVPYAVHGYGSYMSLSVLDCGHRPDMTRDEALHLLRQCVSEVQHRFVYNLNHFRVSLLDADGLHELEPITVGDAALPGDALRAGTGAAAARV